MTRLFISLVLLAVTTAAGATPSIPAPPQVQARAYVLMDQDSGRVLAAAQPDARLEPASLTKIMTSYVVAHELKAGRIHLTDKVRISEKAWRMEGSRMFVEVNKEVTIEELLKGVIVQSGNDASVALAEHIAGGEDAFAQLMNTHAKRFGMKNSHFMNATGMPDPQHYTTARDLAILTRALIRDFPEHYAWHSLKEFSYNGITQANRNRLLWRDSSVDGVKTGHTETAGYCMVSSAKRDRMRLIAAILGSPNDKIRTDESQKLLTYGFRFFETHRLYQAKQPLTSVRVWKGSAEQARLGLAEDLYVTIPRGQYASLKAGMNIDNHVMAPLPKGQQVGKVKVNLGEQAVAERQLVALDDIGEGGLWRTMVDEVLLMLE